MPRFDAGVSVYRDVLMPSAILARTEFKSTYVMAAKIDFSDSSA